MHISPESATGYNPRPEGMRTCVTIGTDRREMLRTFTTAQDKRINCRRGKVWKQYGSLVVIGAVVTKPIPTVIFCQTTVSSVID